MFSSYETIENSLKNMSESKKQSEGDFTVATMMMYMGICLFCACLFYWKTVRGFLKNSYVTYTFIFLIIVLMFLSFIKFNDREEVECSWYNIACAISNGAGSSAKWIICGILTVLVLAILALHSFSMDKTDTNPERLEYATKPDLLGPKLFPRKPVKAEWSSRPGEVGQPRKLVETPSLLSRMPKISEYEYVGPKLPKFNNQTGQRGDR